MKNRLKYKKYYDNAGKIIRNIHYQINNNVRGKDD